MNIFNFVKSLVKPKKVIYAIGPNTFAELLKQFDTPPKEKTQQDIIRDYQVKETMAALEVDMLKMDPSITFLGSYVCSEENNAIRFDWVPCVVRPEVIYCSFSRS